MVFSTGEREIRVNFGLISGREATAAEIEELRWQPLDGMEDVEDLAPLARWYALPAGRRMQS